MSLSAYVQSTPHCATVTSLLLKPPISGNVPPVGVTAASKAEIKVCNWQVAVAGLWLANSRRSKQGRRGAGQRRDDQTHARVLDHQGVSSLLPAQGRTGTL
ncbi:hypothetical protein LMH87_011723 [Akanthomyces muscarius]|uniref:Uncharacterized protein n=1 Tax=Akanthomyces muscarius TaxID=2231603 RepID=A0A9W8Q9Q9_AKAMU|nr:hypothetical protein LMH87_011723 [Akanthomyces muscarius]KAJ4151002.1 hypothetical protein LMH87_011723 [Akanthomyces muscarius]